MPPGPESVFDPVNLRRGAFTYFPVVPGRAEFAVLARKAILEMRPAIVALELPECWEAAFRHGLRRLPELSVILCAPRTLMEDDPEMEDEIPGDPLDEATYFPIEPADPFVEAARTASEIGARLLFLEPDTLQRPHVEGSYPDTYSIARIGLNRYLEQYRLFPQPRNEQMDAHAAAMAWKLQGADPLAPTMIVLSLNLLDSMLDAMEQPQEAPEANTELGVRLIQPHPECLAEITVETPWLQERYLNLRESAPGELPDRPRLQYALLKEAESNYTAITGEKMQHWQRRMLARFTRNLARISGDLMASLYDLTLAARSIVDDNFAWEVWRTANGYSHQRELSDVETAMLTAREVFLNTRKLRIRRRMPRPKQLTRPVSLKPHKREKKPGEWAASLDGNTICSYPPEDLVIEDYGRFLKRKGKSVLSEERSRVEPFVTSILDGIDIRETIRNWHQGRIYVRHVQRLFGEVGAVVIVFDEDAEDRYRYLTTWLGENQNESDMAFYATNPFDNMTGPGIGRAEYGGLLMTLPPRRLFDVWTDSDYEMAENKPERLLLAALDYSTDRYVVYVASKPPRSLFRSIANHLGRKIIYIPLGQLSPTVRKKMRVVHVLDSHARRETAKDYIW
ncbi:MAG: hypothetical protein HYZ37_19065 [Candidatus Solibacter usitatus]|nr:hypothetical protein [Candidatus Solibacter usitatus]